MISAAKYQHIDVKINMEIHIGANFESDINIGINIGIDMNISVAVGIGMGIDIDDRAKCQCWLSFRLSLIFY